MNLVALLGSGMKSDEVLEILEHFELTVIYDFDRTHENMDDLYWASAKSAGFELRFNAHQILDTIFLYAQVRDGFSPIDRTIAAVPFFATFDDANTALRAQGLDFRTSPGEMGSPGYKWWIKANHGTHTVHYQYNREGELAVVTVSWPAGA